MRTNAFFQNGLGNCAGESNTVLYNAVTGTFSCGTDDGAGASANVWSTTTNELVIRPTNNAYVLIIGNSATTTNATLEVHGGISADFFSATSTTATSALQHVALTALSLNNQYVTDLTGSGLLLVSGALTLDVTGNWTGTFDSYEGSYYLANSFSTTSADFWDTTKTPRNADNLADNRLLDLQDVGTTTTGRVLLYWNGTQWTDIATSSLGISTTDLTEGANLFFTDTRVASYISSSSSIPHVSGSSIGDILVWNGVGWATTSTSTLGTTLNDLTDVNTGGTQPGDILYWSGTQWVHTSTSTLVADADLHNLIESGNALTITGGTGAIVGTGDVTLSVDTDVEALQTLEVQASSSVQETVP